MSAKQQNGCFALNTGDLQIPGTVSQEFNLPPAAPIKKYAYQNIAVKLPGKKQPGNFIKKELNKL